MKLCGDETAKKAANWQRERKKFRSLKINLCLFMLCEHIASGFSIIHISLRCTALMKLLGNERS